MIKRLALTLAAMFVLSTFWMGAPSPGSPPANSPSQAVSSARVTAVHLQVTPAKYAGPCPPTKMQLSATITTNGPGTVWYTMGDVMVAGLAPGAKLPEGTVAFSSAGSKTVTKQLIFPPGTAKQSFNSAAAAEAAMEDAGGKRGKPTESNEADYVVTCTGGAAASPMGGATASPTGAAPSGQKGVVELTVVDPDGAPVANAQVLVKGQRPVYTGALGLTRLELTPGLYVIDVDKRGVGAGFIRVNVRAGATNKVHFQFRRQP